MTGFDNIAQTQAQSQQMRLGYEQLRSQSMGRMNQTIAQGPAMAMDAYSQGMQTELTKRRVESDLRLQESVIEDQFHKNKLNTMLMIDQVDMSREAVRRTRLENNMLEADYRDRSEKEKQSVQQNKQAFYARILPQLHDIDMTIDESGTGLREMTDKEKRAKRANESDRTGMRGREMSYNALNQFIDNYRDGITKEFSFESLNDSQKAVYRDLFQQAYGRPYDTREIRDPGAELEDVGMGGGGQTQPKGQAVAPDPADPFASPSVQEQVFRAQSLIQSDPSVGELVSGMSDQGKQAFTAVVGLAADRLAQRGFLTSDMAASKVMSSITSGEPDSAYYLLLGGMSENDVRTWLKTRPAFANLDESARDKRVDFYFRRLQQWAGNMLQREASGRNQ